MSRERGDVREPIHVLDGIKIVPVIRDQRRADAAAARRDQDVVPEIRQLQASVIACALKAKQAI